jgi:hypothetical protein
MRLVYALRLGDHVKQRCQNVLATGVLGLVDHDVVDLSNLHRQVWVVSCLQTVHGLYYQQPHRIEMNVGLEWQ